MSAHGYVDLGGGINAPVLDMVQVLPYWPVYDQWRAHLECCTECTRTMTERDGMITEMCPEGMPLALNAHIAIREQQRAAGLN